MYNFELMKRIKIKGMTQYQFAKKVKAPNSLVSLVINGKYNLEPEKQERWAKVLDAPVEELFGDMVETAAR
jgi:transcriptional regulator with XRE-family HTH domain